MKKRNLTSPNFTAITRTAKNLLNMPVCTAISPYVGIIALKGPEHSQKDMIVGVIGVTKNIKTG